MTDRRLVEPRLHHDAAPFTFDGGETLDGLTIEYETYGTLSEKRDNAILVCHGLAGSAHAAGFRSETQIQPGWWDVAIGPGKIFDTDRYCVIATTTIGGNGASTGPASIDPGTGRPYGMRFPRFTLDDTVRAQRRLIDAMGIETLHAVAGGCMGGSQALLWGLRHPGRAARIIAISVRPETAPSSIALWEVVRQAICSDPDWRGGDHYESAYPRRGVGLANMISLLHLIDDTQFSAKYGRNRLSRRTEGPTAPAFMVEHMLDRVGQAQNATQDPNSLIRLTQAIAAYDLAEGQASLADALQDAAGRYLLVSYERDRRYPPADTERLAQALRAGGAQATHVTLDNPISHGAYQYDVSDLTAPVCAFLD